jgi:hypothetical protein
MPAPTASGRPRTVSPPPPGYLGSGLACQTRMIRSPVASISRRPSDTNRIVMHLLCIFVTARSGRVPSATPESYHLVAHVQAAVGRNGVAPDPICAHEGRQLLECRDSPELDRRLEKSAFGHGILGHSESLRLLGS